MEIIKDFQEILSIWARRLNRSHSSYNNSHYVSFNKGNHLILSIADPEDFNCRTRGIWMTGKNHVSGKSEVPRKAGCDTLFDGELLCWQHVDGYRFSMDSILLAHLVTVRQDMQVLDLGTGCGILGLILLYRHQGKNLRVTGLEKQAGLFGLAERNIVQNELSEQFIIHHRDINHVDKVLGPESCDLVVTNPPYYPPHSGRTSMDEESFIARHQESKTLESFVRAAAFSVKNRGTVGFIYPANLLTDLLTQFQAFRLEPKTLQLIYSYPHDSTDAKLVFVEAIKNGGAGLSVRTPLYIYQDKRNTYTETIQAMYDSRDNSSV